MTDEWGRIPLTLTGDLPRIQPLIPADWRWLALRRVPYHGEEISYFVVRARDAFHIYTTCEIDSNHPHSVFATCTTSRPRSFAGSGPAPFSNPTSIRVERFTTTTSGANSRWTRRQD